MSTGSTADGMVSADSHVVENPSLWHGLVPEDRWAVILYVRALQRAQTGTAADVTTDAGKQTLGLK